MEDAQGVIDDLGEVINYGISKLEKELLDAAEFNSLRFDLLVNRVGIYAVQGDLRIIYSIIITDELALRPPLTSDVEGGTEYERVKRGTRVGTK